MVLLERKQLTCGTTWHAAGLVGQLRATRNLTRLAKYTAELYAGAGSGDRPGDRLPADRLAWRSPPTRSAWRSCSAAPRWRAASALEVDVITPAAGARAVAAAATSTTWSARVHLPEDGQANPGRHHAGAGQGRAQRGARIFENAKVTGDPRRPTAAPSACARRAAATSRPTSS